MKISELKSGMKSLFVLALPIYIGQIGQNLIGFGDMFVAAKHSTNAVAAIGVAVSVSNPLFLLGLGLTFGISSFLSIKRGEGDSSRNHLLNIILYALFIGFLITFATLLLNPLTSLIGIDPKIIDDVIEYNSIVAFSFPFAILFNALKEYEQAYEEVFLANFISVLAIFINIAVNFVFVFGYDNLVPAMGLKGLAYASLSIRVLMSLVFLLIVLRKEKMTQWHFGFIKELFNFSYMIGMMFFLEVLAFCIVGVLSGIIGETAAATNNIVINFATVAILAPMSLGSAASVKIGFEYGSKNIDGVKKYLISSQIIILTYIAFTISCFLLLNRSFMEFISEDPKIIELGIKVFIIIALFQFFDNLQIIFTGILRGLGEVKLPFFIMLFSYWIIGIPFGSYLTFKLNWGLEGLWVGLAISLFIVSVLLFLTIRMRVKYFISAYS